MNEKKINKEILKEEIQYNLFIYGYCFTEIHRGQIIHPLELEYDCKKDKYYRIKEK